MLACMVLPLHMNDSAQWVNHGVSRTKSHPQGKESGGLGYEASTVGKSSFSV